MTDLWINRDVQFKKFTTLHPNWEETFGVKLKDHKKYKRIVCIWQENEQLRHEFFATININTGDIFLDCGRKRIFAKHLVLVFVRPLHTIVKTLWHISIVAPLAVEIYRVKKGKQTFRDLRTNTLHSLADIARTPMYGTALTVMHLAAILAGSAAPNTLYNTRDICGRLERSLLRNDFDDAFWLSPCFSPLSHILPDESDEHNCEDEIKESLTDLAALHVTYLRETCQLFSGCRRLPADEAYISQATAI